MGLFNIATDEEIKKGDTTDVYFVRTKQILEARGLSKKEAVAEVTSGELPRNWPWGILCGVDEVINLFEGCPVNVYSMPEGSAFFPTDHKGIREPVMFVEGPYAEYAVLETPLLGFLCQASGICTASSRIKKLAKDKLVLSFGIRRMHPAIAPMIDRAAYIGGLDGISCITCARRLGLPPSGTMPHALIIMFKHFLEQSEALKTFDEVLPKEVPRVALADTYSDEKIETIMAAEAMGSNIWGVRLDTPSSRRGNFAQIVREVRWELDIRGYKDVKIFLSGGIGEGTITPLIEAGADGFGVGTSISNSPTIDFALDIVEIEGTPVAKKGKLGGKKQVWRCEECMTDTILLFDEKTPLCSSCNAKTKPMLKQIIKNGKIVQESPPEKEIRDYVLQQIQKLTL